MRCRTHWPSLAVPVIAALLTACTATPSPKPALETATTPAAAPADSASCKAAGGQWIAVGRIQKQTCAMPYPDAGKTCQDKRDCIGICRGHPGAGGDGTPATGTCQRNDQDRFGCYAEIIDGKARPAICVD